MTNYQDEPTDSEPVEPMLDDEPSFDSDPAFDEPAIPSAPPATAAPSAPAARQLVRDPYTKLGGVSSGISQHYGLDVSLVRLAFVLFTFVSGFGLLMYLLAWLIIPRAKFWPPVGAQPLGRQLSGRELGVGLLLVGALVALFINGGAFSQVLAPLVLIGGGVWLLTQSPSPSTAGAVPAMADAGYVSDTTDPLVQPPLPPTPGVSALGSPVPPRSRGRKVAIVAAIGAVLLIPVAMVAAFVGAVIFSDEITVEAGETQTFEPTTVGAIPTSIVEEEGEIILDLTALEAADFTEPVEVDIDLDFGRIEVIVPEELAVNAMAEGFIGEATVFDDNADGFTPEAQFSSDDPDLILDLSVDFGEVVVRTEG